VEEESKLFMTHSQITESVNAMWFIDSGCSNHMSSSKSLFRDLDKSQKSEVRLGDDKQVHVEGKGIVEIKTVQGNVKLLYDVQYVPTLAHNLLSVGQLITSRYSVVFDDQACDIKDKKSGRPITHVSMTKNKMFPLDISSVENIALVVKGKNETNLWHLRCGHLNVNGLKLLVQKDMVIGLPKINELDLCEGCIYGKQAKKSFPVGKSWRATTCLELVHADLCGPMKMESLGGSRYV